MEEHLPVHGWPPNENIYLGAIMTLELEEQLLLPFGIRKMPLPEERRGRPTSGLTYLSHFVTEQDKDQRVEDQLRGLRHGVEIHEQHVGKEQEEGDVEDHVPGEDHKRGGEEGYVVPQELPVLVEGLLPAPRGDSRVTVLANITAWATPLLLNTDEHRPTPGPGTGGVQIVF